MSERNFGLNDYITQNQYQLQSASSAKEVALAQLSIYSLQAWEDLLYYFKNDFMSAKNVETNDVVLLYRLYS